MNIMELPPTVSSSYASAVSPSASEADSAAPDTRRRIVAAWRRHWKWGLPLALILALAGGITGYLCRLPQYQASATIRVRPILPRVLYQTEQTSVMPMFDAFIDSQVAMIRSQRVLTMAMQAPTWRSLGRGTSGDDLETFRKNIDVAHPKGSELIIVTVTDHELAATAIATKALVEAYEKIYAESDGTQNAQLMQVLEARSATLNAEIKSLNARVSDIANEQGSATLDRICDAKLTQLSELEAELRRAQIGVALAGGGGQGSATQPSQAQQASMDVDVIASVDPDMHGYIRQRDEARQKLDMVKLNLLPNHKTVREAEAEVQALGRRIEQYAEQYRKNHPDGVSLVAGNLDQMQQRERQLRPLVEQARSEFLELGRKQIQIAGLRRDVEDKQALLHDTKTRLEQLSVESGVGGRINVLTYGETPAVPYSDKRLQGAVMGSFGGGMLGMAILALLGLTEGRCQSISDAQDTSTRRAQRVLGILPSLPDALPMPEQAALAAHYVHQIRSLLQIEQNAAGPTAYVVTSSAPGTGKTSLTVALGLSFAASGAKTLLIDCDIVSGALTRRMEKMTRSRIGQILRREELLSAEQLDEALILAGKTHRLLGEVLVERKYVTEADVLHALSLQSESYIGLLDVLAGDALEECVTGTGIANLSILPLGSATQQHVGRLSPSALHQLVTQAKQRYDTVLIDTGPIPGSIEGAMVAAKADKVVMVVARGERRRTAEQAMDYLTSLGARIAGVVFNRADPLDMATAGYSSSASRGDQKMTISSRPGSCAKLGPVAQAVETFTLRPIYHGR